MKYKVESTGDLMGEVVVQTLYEGPSFGHAQAEFMKGINDVRNGWAVDVNFHAEYTDDENDI